MTDKIPWTQTLTGKQLVLSPPNPDQIDIEDIAHGLGHVVPIQWAMYKIQFDCRAFGLRVAFCIVHKYILRFTDDRRSVKSRVAFTGCPVINGVNIWHAF